MRPKLLSILSIVSLIFLVNCSMNKDNISIYKKWQFIKYDVINVDPSAGLYFGSKDTIQFMDLTNKSTLKFFINNKSNPVLIPYKIVDSAVIMQGEKQEIRYKIWNLTNNELELVLEVPGVIDVKKSDKNLIAMLFKIK